MFTKIVISNLACSLVGHHLKNQFIFQQSGIKFRKNTGRIRLGKMLQRVIFAGADQKFFFA